ITNEFNECPVPLPKKGTLVNKILAECPKKNIIKMRREPKWYKEIKTKISEKENPSLETPNQNSFMI
ncbi:15081_t:CDS:2, partial [Gigaspora margarita]